MTFQVLILRRAQKDWQDFRTMTKSEFAMRLPDSRRTPVRRDARNWLAAMAGESGSVTFV